MRDLIDLRTNWIVKAVALLLQEITPNSEGFQSKSRVLRLGMPFIQNILMQGLYQISNYCVKFGTKCEPFCFEDPLGRYFKTTFLKYLLLKYNIFYY